MKDLTQEAITLLSTLIETPSFSKEEEKTAEVLSLYLQKKDIQVYQDMNNLWAWSNNSYDENKKTILLNSHHDTVRPGNWGYPPFKATIENDKIIGLGSNDAGGSLVSLIMAFVHLNKQPLPYNLLLGISAEEEISGKNGIKRLLKNFNSIDLAIVGEPTQMRLAIAERGLIVVDCVTKGVTGHSARYEGVNALYLAIEDIQWLRQFQPKKESEMLGRVKTTVTKIESGTQHNVIPDKCHYLIDIRTNEYYSNQEILATLKANLNAEITPRSYHLNSSFIDPNHPFVKLAKKQGIETFGSPTLSDQSVMDFNSVKIGPGNSSRSHTPDEYILISEIKHGIETYIQLLENVTL